MVGTNYLKKGITIKKVNKLWFVISSFFVKPGKGAAFYKAKLREIKTGKVVEYTFKSGEEIDLVDTERRNVQFLYQGRQEYVFMDEENYEQYHLKIDIVGEEVARFLKEEQKLVLFFVEEEPISISFVKQKLSFKVVEAPPGVKGDTVSNAFKTVTIDSGAKIQTPLFIKEGEEIIVNVETGEYCERTKGN